MNEQITCPHCGDTYPDFDAAHVCSRGSYAVKLKPKMNKRIRELKHQASVWCDENIPEQFSEETNGYGSAWEEKFAELIVQECMTQIQQVREIKAGHAGPEYTQGFDDGMFVAISTIEEHFGVEEK